MVTRCVNPSCGAYSFEYLRGGKLFLRDLRYSQPTLQQVSAAVKKTAAVEYFWLCEKCSVELTVIVDRYGRPGVVEVQPTTNDAPSESVLPPEAA